jgi:hypothetical protein
MWEAIIIQPLAENERGRRLRRRANKEAGKPSTGKEGINRHSTPILLVPVQL